MRNGHCEQGKRCSLVSLSYHTLCVEPTSCLRKVDSDCFLPLKEIKDGMSKHRKVRSRAIEWEKDDIKEWNDLKDLCTKYFDLTTLTIIEDDNGYE